MNDEDPQKIWEAYYERKRLEKHSEANILHRRMQDSGVTTETVLALDFQLFGDTEENISALGAQLSESYEISAGPSDDEGYFLLKGTTRPQGITLTLEQHLSWVEFMCDVGQSYGCVFSTWTLEAPVLKESFKSEDVEGAH